VIAARLIDVAQSTPRTRWLRLQLDRPFVFRAGQAVFAGVTGTDLRAAYSIASPPALGDSGVIELLVGAEGAFGQSGVDPVTLSGTEVDVDGPFGQFGVPADRDGAPLLLVAGGTGIAPLRSVILDRLDRGVIAPMTLVYSARTPDEFACGDELLALGSGGRLEVHLTVTRDDTPAASPTRSGRVNDALLRAALPSNEACCLVCGPTGFVESSVTALTGIGVSARQIVIER
jgi:NAD(P)H-flavin reductase